MKKILLTILVLYCTLSASTEILNLQADYSSGLVKLQWQTGKEVGIKQLIVEKSPDGKNFTALTSENPKGSNSDYLVLDKTLYGRALLHYRVKVVSTDNSVATSDVVKINIVHSGISATWGSIKAMFR